MGKPVKGKTSVNNEKRQVKELCNTDTASSTTLTNGIDIKLDDTVTVHCNQFNALNVDDKQIEQADLSSDDAIQLSGRALQRYFSDLTREINTLKVDFANRLTLVEETLTNEIVQLRTTNLELKTELTELKHHFLKAENKNSKELIKEIKTSVAEISLKKQDGAYFSAKIDTDISEALRESAEREAKKNNLVIFNLPENNDDSESIGKMYDALKLEKRSNLQLKRIGDPAHHKSRPLIVKYDSFKDKMDLLVKAKNLRHVRDGNFLQKVFVKPDLTRLQQKEDKLLRDEMKRRNDAGENVFIKGGKIVSRDY